ncbi:tRNA lysidine(34) synthetase TilS [Lacinutrix sp. Hel_I_90]|uniref:tRNA lysidine(34) synthetase TilS n=1 Tax=Lacinutrix sp. Hel_I_90 TaxID=1249999 RepID=UPI0005C83C93|nr:tRNA lysidine(34) synthetase TilS [Lacinutrix sp. Hel_I_90]
MQDAFKKQINTNLPFLNKSRLLIAISGGLDSVVLAQLCHNANLDFALAHCNFNLRGSESDADEAFVLDLAEDLDREIFIQHFETERYAETHKLSIQMAARELRYEWFYDLAEQLKFDYILTAHHADDNLETLLINLTRGTGIDGLTGIPEINGKIARPLLKFSRETLASYAKTKHLKWREDSSNASTKYLRNKLRHDVIPLLKEINPKLLQNIDHTISHLNDTADIVEESVGAVLKRAIKSMDEHAVVYGVQEFIKLNNPKAYLFEVFKNYGFSEWNDIENLLKAQSGKQVFSATHKLLKNRETLILTALVSEAPQDAIVITSEDKTVETTQGVLVIEAVETLSEQSKNVVYVDAQKLKFPLIVRHWKKGDYFCPLGMQGKKKLSKFFKDEKLSLLDKEKCLLLCSQEDIVWVINYRADDRFKVTKQTHKMLKISIQ